MKKTMKVLGLIALAAIVGLAMIACDGLFCEHEWEESKKPYFGAEGEEICIDCGEVQVIPALDQTALFGTWARTAGVTNPQILTINRTIISVINVAGQSFVFEVNTGGWSTSAVANTYDNAVGPAETYKLGYRVQGNTRGAISIPGITAVTEMSIYLHEDLDKLWIWWGAVEGGNPGGGIFDIVH